MIKRMLKFVPPSWRRKTTIINVVRLEGAIISGRGGLQQKLNAKELEPVLKKAFRKGVSGVALQVNCPGGSPVQSALIATRIRELAEKHRIPVYAFCEDVAASGGYWLACAADEIYADENSIVGSIGVISMGFGFPRALAKLGVERRVYTAGEFKSTNDPFKPERPGDVKRLTALLEEMHSSFKAMVRERRKGRLKATEKELFSGAFWTGAKAADLGLVDAVGQMHAVLGRKFGENLELRPVEAAGGWGLRRFGFGAGIRHLPDATIDALETRALWSRFGI
jgi:signal peptide peptidase SppA